MSKTNTVSPLRQRMIEDMTARKLNPHTQRSHIYTATPSVVTNALINQVACSLSRRRSHISTPVLLAFVAVRIRMVRTYLLRASCCSAGGRLMTFSVRPLPPLQ
jgi:hypothetical protein